MPVHKARQRASLTRADDMTTETQTHQFEAETREVLDLMIHSLYTNREIFLRELISNSSDALDRLRFRALTEEGLLGDDDRLHIELSVDAEAKTLTIEDNGAGMTREEIISNLGTIARSGTKNFLSKIREQKGSNAPELIGQFGVGFYSAFMVAEEVEVLTRAAGSDDAWLWRSRAEGEYELEPAEKAERGTRITLKMREASEEEGDSPEEYLAEYRLREIVRRYSDFVEHPIEMEVTRNEPELDEEGKPIEGQTKEVTTRETLNSMRPLWSRDKSEISKEEYAEFYRHFTHDWTEPHETVHFKAEGTQEFTALLFIPSQRPFDMFDGSQRASNISLYVKRVFITSDCEELLPSWMRFVKGLVDSSDLPLNISRETLQENRVLKQIKKRLVGKVLDTLTWQAANEREEYEKFWTNFGTALKEGVITGEDEEGRIAKLLMFGSTNGDERTTLAEYVERMGDDQEAIYVLTSTDGATAASSPHLEVFRKKGLEVLFFDEPADEWLADRLREFDGKPVRVIQKGDLGLESEEEKSAREAMQADESGLLETIQGHLDQTIKEVRLSTRLSDSPAVLVTDAEDMSPAMKRMLERAGQPVPDSKRILELNPEHALFARLRSLYEEDTQSPKLAGLSELLLGQALIFEGVEVPDPVRFGKLLTDLMVGAD